MPNAEYNDFVCVHPEALAYAQVHDLALPESLPCRSTPHTGDHFQLIIAHGLALQALQLGKVNPIRVDFVAGKLAHRRQYGGGRKQDIARACGLHQVPDLSVLDATAGLGRDGFVLASLGAHVHLIERNPLLAALLADGLQRARTVGEPTLLAVLDRLGLSANEALQVPLSVLGQPDVVYLDPMFPAREKSARVKADMQVLHVLLDQAPTTADEDVELMQWALALADKRVVVKRPRLANPLGGHRPDHQLVGKANRFDVYTLKRLAS